MTINEIKMACDDKENVCWVNDKHKVIAFADSYYMIFQGNDKNIFDDDTGELLYDVDGFYIQKSMREMMDDIELLKEQIKNMTKI